MRVLSPLWSAIPLGLAPFEEALRPADVVPSLCEGPAIGPFASNGTGGIGGGRTPDLDPSSVTLFTPSTKARLANLFQGVLDRLPPRDTTERMRAAPRLLMEQGLSNGHFDPSFWLIDAWFGRKYRKKPLVTGPVRTLVLTHFQKDLMPITRRRAARWIAVNILVQNRAMEAGRWFFPHSRRIDMFKNRMPQLTSLGANDYWRSDGSQGGVWFYPREVSRDDSSHGRYILIAAIPEPFVYHFTTLNQSGAVVLPGPIPPKLIIKQGWTSDVLNELKRDHGGLQAYLSGLERALLP